jgi:hypothetical protein
MRTGGFELGSSALHDVINLSKWQHRIQCGFKWQQATLTDTVFDAAISRLTTSVLKTMSQRHCKHQQRYVRATMS